MFEWHDLQSLLARNTDSNDCVCEAGFFETYDCIQMVAGQWALLYWLLLNGSVTWTLYQMVALLILARGHWSLSFHAKCIPSMSEGKCSSANTRGIRLCLMLQQAEPCNGSGSCINRSH